MNDAAPRSSWDGAARAVAALLASAPFQSALATVSMATLLFALPLQRLTGWAGYIAIIGALVLLAAGAAAARWRLLDWHGLLPISLLVFLGWCALTVLWSDYPDATVAGVLYQVAVASLALSAALTRSLLQLIRAFGDALRAALLVSLALEILAGLLIDSPIPLLGIRGDLADGGPIQGAFGSRNQFGLVAMLAAVTFAVEWATRSVTRTRALLSAALAGLCLAFIQSPVTAVVLLVLLAATAVLVLLRRAAPENRRTGQTALLSAVVIGGLAVFVNRVAIIDAFGAAGATETRLDLWRSVLTLLRLRAQEGWGWIGTWRDTEFPYFSSLLDEHGSALNAYLDVALQTGAIGAIVFVLLCGLALVRAWLVASSKRSLTHLWAALALLCLLLTAAAESALLVGFPWFVFVTCVLVSARELSWRRRLPERS